MIASAGPGGMCAACVRAVGLVRSKSGMVGDVSVQFMFVCAHLLCGLSVCQAVVCSLSGFVINRSLM